MNKAVILPIIAVICLAIQAITGHEIDKVTQESVANAIAILVTFGVSVWGILRNFKKEKAEVKQVVANVEAIAKEVEQNTEQK